MPLNRSWYTIDEAISKFGVSARQLQEWVDHGVVRAEEGEGGEIMLNGDDIGQELRLIPSV